MMNRNLLVHDMYRVFLADFCEWGAAKREMHVRSSHPVHYILSYKKYLPASRVAGMHRRKTM